MVLAVNEFGNPSNCSPQLFVKINFVDPGKNLNLDDLKSMPYVFLGVIAIIAIIAINSVRSKKKTGTKSEMKKSLKSIMEEEYNVDKQGKKRKTLSDRLDEMESLVEEQITGEKTTVKRTSEEDLDIDALLGMTINEEKQESIIGDGGLKKCPYCGWSISKGATKCPRCQKTFY